MSVISIISRPFRPRPSSTYIQHPIHPLSKRQYKQREQCGAVGYVREPRPRPCVHILKNNETRQATPKAQESLRAVLAPSVNNQKGQNKTEGRPKKTKQQKTGETKKTKYHHGRIERSVFPAMRSLQRLGAGRGRRLGGGGATGTYIW